MAGYQGLTILVDKNNCVPRQVTGSGYGRKQR
jgi:hypothetical protein